NSGGASSLGVLFEFDLATSSYTKKVDFTSTNGAGPRGDLFQASNNMLYGLTYAGGANGHGVIFEYDPSTGSYVKQVDLLDATTGKNPAGSFVQATNGKLYATTFAGGSSGFGTLLEYTTGTTSATININFGSEGKSPYGSLMLSSSGLLYGMTNSGGVNNAGVLFEYNTSTNSLSTKVNFSPVASGSYPTGNIIQLPGGALYGMTPSGGSVDNGVIFSYDPVSDFYEKKIDFSNSINGAGPQSGLIEASNGSLFGLTKSGGNNGSGVLFEFNPVTPTFIKRHDFSASTTGASPSGNLKEASDGKLYGLTEFGGVSNQGVLFQFDVSSGSVINKVDFNGSSNGANPKGDLTQVPSGKLYGMTNAGGANGVGVLFEYDPSTSTYTKKADFNLTNGASPDGGLLLAANNKLYGMTKAGGLNDLGVLFEFDPITGVLTKKIDFFNINGANPTGTLLQSNNGLLYGVTTGGGNNSAGVLFEYDPLLNTATVRVHFSTTTGSTPNGTLIEVVGGNLYGMTSSGGASGKGTLFQYDRTSSSFNVLVNFNGTNGALPKYAAPLLVPKKLSQSVSFNALPPKNAGDPPFALSASASSGLGVSFLSSDSDIASVSGNLVTIHKFGTVLISARQLGNDTYGHAQDVVRPLVINKSDQTITFGALTPKTFGDPAFLLTASASSGLNVTYASSDPSIASITSSTVTILKAGTITITASQVGNANYNPAPDVQQTLIINKANQTIAFGLLPTKTFGDAPFNLTANSSSGLAVTFVSMHTNVATVSGTLLTITGAGTADIIAQQSGNSDYNAAPDVLRSIIIDKANQTITFTTLPTKTFGDPPFPLNAATTSGLPITYSSSDTNFATVSGNTVTILKAGTVIITASQAGDANFNAALSVPQNLIIDKANQTITFNALPIKSTFDLPFTLSASSSSGLGVTFTSSNPSVASVSGNTVTLLSVGTTTITANQAGDGNYNAAPAVNQPLVVNSKQPQTITFNPLSARAFGDAPFFLTATASSGLSVTYTSSDPSVASVSGNTVSIVGVGNTIITARQAGDASFNPAPPVDQNLVVNKANQTITFGPLASVPANNPPITLTATTTSGLPISYSSSNTSVATISGNLLTLAGAIGTTTITASQAGNANYNSATPVLQDLVVQKRSQTISFTVVPGQIVLGDSPFAVSAMSSSGLPVSFQVGPNSISKISIAGNIVTFLSSGIATIRAIQNGDATYSAAEPIDRIFCINPAKPTVTVSSPSPNTFVLTSNSSSGNQWFRNGTAITNATSTTYTPPQSGSYQVTATVESCTSDFSTAQAIVITGDLPLIKNGLIVYPNPVTNKLSIDLSSLSTAQVQLKILDATGRLIHEEAAVGGKTVEVPMSAQAPGLYLLFVGQGERSSYARFVKE
ncbi:MAG: T9SS type A sorting domain-containing protein, partial [Cyclobacteriaceae bacterium]|nr:T9SS type A sorting domain-containing protein [Cyclobacteriaceae bacterium]